MQATIQIGNITNLNNVYIINLVVIVFAFLLSLCSTSDSFIAKTLVNIVPNNSVLAFLILGPMIDVKNTIVLSKGFNKKFVITLITLIFVFTYFATVFIKI